MKMRVIECDKEVRGLEMQAAIALVTANNASPQVFLRGRHIGNASQTLHLIETGEFQEMAAAGDDDVLWIHSLHCKLSRVHTYTFQTDCPLSRRLAFLETKSQR